MAEKNNYLVKNHVRFLTDKYLVVYYAGQPENAIILATSIEDAYERFTSTNDNAILNIIKLN